MTFRKALAEQRWDDHRYYHHSRINQALHFVSALCFIVAYALLPVEPALAVLIAWLLAMPSRQIGHFFFEPRDYDHLNQATHEHKEAIKVGYNLRRKVVLMSAWTLAPAVLAIEPTGFGLVEAHTSWPGYVNNVAMLWLGLGVAALLGRTVQLFFIRDVQTGLVWCTKILTDPFNDLKLYHRAPLYLLRGELVDPIVARRT
jgi:hypothetical protein